MSVRFEKFPRRGDTKCVISLKWQSCTGESCAAGSREARGTRNGQISVSVESRSSKTSRGENINVGTSILGHVVFFLAFVALFLTGIKKARSGTWLFLAKRAVASSRRTRIKVAIKIAGEQICENN